MKLVVSIAALCAAYPLVLSAQTERDLDAHVHGQAAANIAVFDSNVVIDIESPWNNLVGFEYAAKSDEEIAAVAEAVAMLNQPESVIGLIGGNCKADQVTVESSLSDDDHDDEHHDDDTTMITMMITTTSMTTNTTTTSTTMSTRSMTTTITMMSMQIMTSTRNLPIRLLPRPTVSYAKTSTS